MADSSNEVQTNIYRHLQPIISERLLTPEQADTIVKFISTDYPVRRAIRISSITQASAYTNLYLLLEFLRKNSPISIVDEHVSDLFHTLVVGLCWHFEGSWFDKLLEFSHEIKSVRDLGFMETLEGRKKHLTVSDSQRFNPKRKGQSNEALKAKKAFQDRDDGRVEELEIFENKVSHIDPELRRVCAELKTVREARAKLASLEFDIFSPTIILEKAVTSGVKVKDETS